MDGMVKLFLTTNDMGSQPTETGHLLFSERPSTKSLDQIPAWRSCDPQPRTCLGPELKPGLWRSPTALLQPQTTSAAQCCWSSCAGPPTQRAEVRPIMGIKPQVATSVAHDLGRSLRLGLELRDLLTGASPLWQIWNWAGVPPGVNDRLIASQVGCRVLVALLHG